MRRFAFQTGMWSFVAVPLEIAEDAYRLGQTGLIELMDSSRTRTEIKLNHLELIQNEIEAELDVMNASGLLAVYFENPA